METNDDRREFFRVDHQASMKFKVQQGEKFVGDREVSTRNVSPNGLLFRTESEASIPPIGSVLFIELDDRMLSLCEEIEHDLVMKDKGVYGRVVRISEGEPDVSYDIGVCFLRRKNLDESQIQTLE